MEHLGSFPRVLNVLPQKNMEGPLRNFLKANPWPHPRPDQRPKTLGFLAFGLALDVASGSPFENPLGDLQSSYSAFPQIVPLSMYGRRLKESVDIEATFGVALLLLNSIPEQMVKSLNPRQFSLNVLLLNHPEHKG